MKPEDLRVILATDCGSTTTKAILIELKPDGYRQTFRGEAPTTVEVPVRGRHPRRAQSLLRNWRSCPGGKFWTGTDHHAGGGQRGGGYLRLHQQRGRRAADDGRRGGEVHDGRERPSGPPSARGDRHGRIASNDQACRTRRSSGSARSART